ncbi:MAG: adenylate/guanylate cyclase domain-containing protein [Granulosicoccus sp.]
MERRQVTVLFCDLCGSTDLSQRLDPEDLARVLRLYQDACTPIMQKHGGYISRYLGDGIVTLFGYPSAQDDAAFHAVVASLELVEHFQNYPVCNNEQANYLSVRIGVATGLVLAGDMIGSGHATEQPVVGQTPNLAARLQSVGEENTVVLSEATYRLVYGKINCERIGPLSLKGISKPVYAYVASSLVPLPGDPFGQPYSLSASRFINRHKEMQKLMTAWAGCKAGQTETILISADAGMGKSRLVHEFILRIETHQPLVIMLRCLSDATNTPLHPLTELLLDESTGRLAGIKAQLAKHLREESTAALRHVELLQAQLRAFSGASNEDTHGKQPADLFINLLCLISREVPVLLCLEDVHWSDPTTRSLIVRLSKHSECPHVLTVLLTRPPARTDQWVPNRLIELERLDKDEASRMLSTQFDIDSLPEDLLNIIMSKSEGIPLFIEEVTKSLLDHRLHARKETGSELTESSEFTVPDTLRDLLMARLDSLGNAKRTAQLASVIGREFTLQTIASLAKAGTDTLMQHVNSLVYSGLLQLTDASTQPIYQFKHALIQDAAYESLTIAQKKTLHARMAELLQKEAEHDTIKAPEQIATHYQAAGVYREAVHWWDVAAGNALRIAANHEAYHHARQGIKLLDHIRTSHQHDYFCLSLHIILSASIAGTRGDATPELEAIHAKAASLESRVNDDSLSFALTREMHAFYLIRGPVQRACELGRTMLSLADSTRHPQHQLDSKRGLGWTYICHGQLAEGRDLLRRSTSAYRKADSRLHTRHDTIDPGAVGLINLAWAEAIMGDTNVAINLVDLSTRLATEIEHPYSLAYAVCMGAAVHQCCGNTVETLNLAEQCLKTAEKHRFQYFIAWGNALQGWAQSLLQPSADSDRLLVIGQSQYEATGARLFMPHILTLRAETLLDSHHYTRARDLLQRALSIANDNDIHFFSCETLRLMAITQRKLGFDAQASRLFSQAASLSESQGSKGFELRIRHDWKDDAIGESTE